MTVLEPNTGRRAGRTLQEGAEREGGKGRRERGGERGNGGKNRGELSVGWRDRGELGDGGG